MKTSASNKPDFPTLQHAERQHPSQPVQQHPAHGQGQQAVQAEGPGRGDQTDRVKQICSNARKVIGLSPIEPRMLEIQMQSYGAKDIQEAMLR